MLMQEFSLHITVLNQPQLQIHSDGGLYWPVDMIVLIDLPFAIS